jgi:NADH:ubiquinone oxidoreductase subunit F (NADH-binding)
VPRLQRHQALLKYSPEDGDGETYVIFNSEEGEHGLMMDRDVWVDMDRPHLVTMTLEPGDKLNA